MVDEEDAFAEDGADELDPGNRGGKSRLEDELNALILPIDLDMM